MPPVKLLPALLLLCLGLAFPAGSARAQALPEPLAEYLYPPELVRLAAPALNLTEDQKAELQSADEKVSALLAQTKQALAQETAKLVALVKAEKLDNDAIMLQADKVMRLEQESKRATLALLLKIRETLTPEQFAKLKEFKAKTAAFQSKVRQAMELAQKWKQAGRALPEFEQVRSEFESLMGAGNFQAAEALLDKTLKRLQAPAPEPKK
jgi:Spy/CpxP family protein refolding chaperone